MDRLINFINGKYRWLGHLIFWLTFILFYTVAYGNMAACYDAKLLHTLLLLPTIIPATYFTIHVLFNRLLLKKKYTYFILGFIASAIIFSYLQVLMEARIIVPRIYGQTINSESSYLLVGFVHVYAIVILAAILKIMKDYFISRDTNQKLRQEKLETELKFLKGQINPHFLFNTLNNLYSLALHKNKNTAPGILQLSNLMNYMLNESNSEFIELSSEIKLINNYLNLEKLRYTAKLRTSFDIKGKIDGVKIAPLVLLPFVENAFKHGISQKTEDNWLLIFLEIDNNKIKFSVENSIPSVTKKQPYIKNNGIGLKNVKRRLELIYNKNFALNINKGTEQFNVDLIIKFKE